MAEAKVYHNHRFFDYRGNHNRVVPPARPVATVRAPDGLPAEQALEIAFRQTQHLDEGGWWNNDGVTLHVRSTSVGDVLENADSNHFVVENMGFKPYRPAAIGNAHRLAEAYRLLDQAPSQDGHTALHVTRQAQEIVLHVLEMEGFPGGEVPILS